MKNGIITTIDWKLIGATLANADDNDQADFLNAFANEFKAWPTSYQIGMQFASIRAKLTPEAEELLSENLTTTN